MTIRKMIVAGLMAATALGASAPAFAQRGDNGENRGRDGNRGEMRQQRQEQRQQTRQERQDLPRQARQDARGNDGARFRGGDNRPQRVVTPPVQQAQVSPAQRRDLREDRRDVREDRRDVREDVRDARNGNNGWRDRAEDRRDIREDRRDVREDRRDGRNDGRYSNGYTSNRGWNDNRRSDNRYNNGRYDNRAYGNYGNRGYSDNRIRLDSRQRWSNQRRWDNGWRNDRRYDWQNYRRNYGQIYRPGRYYAPRGWNYGYRQFSVGIFLDSLLYSNNYWLDDPYRYRLPPAYGSLRWVRYYDDALLVDTRDGYVVDVINGFFY